MILLCILGRKWQYITESSLCLCVCMVGVYTHTHPHTHIYIGSYDDWCLYSSITSNKPFIRWWPWVQVWFQCWSIITASAVTHDTTRLFGIIYGIAISTLMQLEPYLGSFLCISSSDGERPTLVKNAEVELIMKPWLVIHWLSSHFWYLVLTDPHIFPTYAEVPSQNFLQKTLLTQ